MKIKIVALMSACLFTVTVPQAQARMNGVSSIWSTLDRNGSLTAGWVDVLPVLASVCGFKLNNQELNSTLVDLSQDTGNASYATNLYSTLHLIEQKRAKNSFVAAWTAKFQGKQQEACDTAAALWGDSGRQFPGVLVKQVSFDETGSVPNADKGCR